MPASVERMIARQPASRSPKLMASMHGYLARPQRAEVLVKPKNQPQPMFFNPF